MRQLVLAAVLAMAMPAISRADFVLDDFSVDGQVGDSPQTLGNGFTREFFRSTENNFIGVIGGEFQASFADEDNNVSAVYATASSIDVSGLSQLALGMNLFGNATGTGWTVSVEFTSTSDETESTSLDFPNISDGPLYFDLSGISSSILADLQTIRITWAKNGGQMGTMNGIGSQGIVFNPEPGSLVLLGGASLAGLAFIRRRKANATA